MTYPLTCTAGNYCGPTTRQIAETPCPEGTYSSLAALQEESDCWPCKGGYYCDGTGNSAPDGPCTAGYWCQASAIEATPNTFTTDSFGQCPHFHYCEEGVGYGNVCEPGTYANSNQITQSTDCTAQSPGSYAHSVTTDSDDGASYENPLMTTGTCFEGYYCDGGDAWPKHTDKGCDAGEYCIAGATQAETCDVGEWQPNKLQGKCLACPIGHTCYDGAVSTNGLIADYRCPAGYWCPEGTDADPPTSYACPKGTYQPKEGARAQEECIPAPPGYYIGTEAATTFSTDAALCDEGYYCKLGSWTATPGSTTSNANEPTNLIYADYGGICEKGYYCPEGSTVMLPCTPGKKCTAA
jgi:hypothetical protein